MRISEKVIGQMIIGAALAAASTLILAGFIFLIHSYYFINNHLATDRRDLPSTIYASAPVLRPGSLRDPDWLIDYFHRLDYHRTTSEEPHTGEYSVSRRGIVFRRSASMEAPDNISPVLVVFDGKGIAHIQDLKNNSELPE